jgi:ribosome-associated translation inhibitor RaiA
MQTPPQISFKNMAHSAALEDQVAKRIARLDQLRDDITFCRVVVEAPNHSQGSKPPLAISIEVEVPKRTLIAKDTEQRHEARHDELAAINHAFDAIERQLEDDISVKRDRAKAARRGSRNAGAEPEAPSSQDVD